MTEVRLAVDHLRLDYKGPFEFNQLIRLITSYTKEQGYDIRYDKDFEINTKEGKQFDYQIFPWKKITDYTRYSMKIQISSINMKKVEIIRDNKKVKVDSGRIIMLIDGFIDTDYFGKWDGHPLFLFLRSLYDRFIYKAYTQRFEERFVYDVHHLFDRIEKFLNMYKSYKLIRKSPNFMH